MFRNRRGQSTLEYGLIIAVVVAALLAVNGYMKRATQGRLKESSDQIGRQFDPKTFTTSWKAQSTDKTTTTEKRDKTTGAVTSEITASETTTKDDYEASGTAPAQHY